MASSLKIFKVNLTFFFRDVIKSNHTVQPRDLKDKAITSAVGVIIEHDLQRDAMPTSVEPRLDFKTINDLCAHVDKFVPAANVYQLRADYRVESVAIDRRYDFEDNEERVIVVDNGRHVFVSIEPDFEKKVLEVWRFERYAQFDGKPACRRAGNFRASFADIDKLCTSLNICCVQENVMAQEFDSIAVVFARKRKIQEVDRATKMSLIRSIAEEHGLEVSFDDVRDRQKRDYATVKVAQGYTFSFDMKGATPLQVEQYIHSVILIAKEMEKLPTFRISRTLDK